MEKMPKYMMHTTLRCAISLHNIVIDGSQIDEKVPRE